jgi:hypothetical protein
MCPLGRLLQNGVALSGKGSHCITDIDLTGFGAECDIRSAKLLVRIHVVDVK